jgi:hypothetical protein
MNLTKLFSTLMLVTALICFSVAFAAEKKSTSKPVVVTDEAADVSGETKEDVSGEALLVSGDKEEVKASGEAVIESGDVKESGEKEAEVSGEAVLESGDKEVKTSGEVEAKSGDIKADVSGEAKAESGDKEAKVSGEAKAESGEKEAEKSGETVIESGEKVSGDKTSGDIIIEVVELPVDVKEDSWYAEFVAESLARKLLEVDGDGKFLPQEKVTKAEAVKALEKLAPAKSGDSGDKLFENETELDKEVSREELATLMYEVVKAHNKQFGATWMMLLDFEDVLDIDSKCYEAVAWCNVNKVMVGRPDNTFGAKEVASRAELATVLVRLGDILG